MPSFVPESHAAPSTSFATTKSKAARAMRTRHGWLETFLVLGLLLAGSAAAVRGQSALDGFDPNANGVVRVVVVQADGRILIGGDFTTLSPNGGAPVARNRIGRLNPDGTLDTAFNPSANGNVFAIAVQADGKVLAGGGFTNIGGQPRNSIARLDATNGSVDVLDPFNPNANGVVNAIVVQPADGNILVGGGFTTIGAQPRNYIARLNAASGSADSFDPKANVLVNAIALQASDGKVLFGGQFTTLAPNGGGPVTRNRIARVNPDGTLDTGFDPNANGEVFEIAVQADGKVLAAGAFSGANSIGGQTRNRIARLNASTGLADSFDPNSNDTVFSMAIQPDGKILVGGAIGALTPNGGSLVIRNRVARLNADGTVDGFNPNTNDNVLEIAVQEDGKVLLGGPFNLIGGAFGETRNGIGRVETDGRPDRTLNLNTVGGFVYATAVQPDGRILIGGGFTSVLTATRNNIARLNTDGTLDTGFNPNATGDVYTIAVQPDGQILVGGSFSGLNSIGGVTGQTRNYIARLNANGTLDTGFDPNPDFTVFAIALQADGKVLAGGQFTTLAPNGGGAVTRTYLARLNVDGTLDNPFNPASNAGVFSIAVQTDGRILAGGSFNGVNSIGGVSGLVRNRIARLETGGTLDTAFNPDANNNVFAIAVQPDGQVLAGGQFTTIGGQTRNSIARLDAGTGAADLTFNPNANAGVFVIAVQGDGKILAGGQFSGMDSIGGVTGQTRNRIARLNANGTLDAAFDPNADGIVRSIALPSDGKILVGGEFANIGGQPRNLFARLSNDTAALQNLAVTQTTINWTRGGSSPQFTRVTFEYSNDNVNYSPLGNGTWDGSKWTRTGLSLSTGMNFYVRARGYYRSGYQTGSESLGQSVRNAFVAGPTAADATISGQVTTPDGTALGGVMVNLSGAKSAWTMTDSKGRYRFEDVDTDNFYTVTPGLVNYSFSPANRSFSLLGNYPDAVFTAVLNTALVGNAIDTSEYFVRQQYLDFLGREPDQGGLEYWNNQIASCGNDTACINKRRLDVSASFFMAKEFQETGAFVYGLYKASFGSQPSYKQFTADRAKVIGGMDLETRKNALVDEWVQRDSFRQAYPDSMTPEQFVNKLFESAGLILHTGEWETYVIMLNNGGTRAQVLRSLITQPEFTAKEYNATFVLMEYFGYLKRDPDPGGYAFWLDVLNTREPGNFRGMVCSFITSAEYQKRFSPVITHSNADCSR
ncbi:MAG: DUF4214 domain-containing protein [Pyrinomonadaceae bacterium]